MRRGNLPYASGLAGLTGFRRIVRYGVLCAAFCAFFSVPQFLAAESDVKLELTSSLQDRHTLASDAYVSKDEFVYGGSFDLGLLVTPVFGFEENFQFDSRVDVMFSKRYGTPEIGVSVGELMIDLLFFERLSLQTGFIKMDYGFQSGFHPLAVTGLLPEFEDLFGKISVGGRDRGFKGVPGIGADLTFPEIVPGITFNLRQRVALFDLQNPADAFRHFDRNFFITDLRCTVFDVAFGALCGWSGQSFAERTEEESRNPPIHKRRPVYGANVSAVLPFDVTVLWEGTLKEESFRGHIEDGVYRTYGKATSERSETGDFYLSSDVRVEWIARVERDHTLNLTGEYFYDGEGLTSGMYDLGREYMEKSDLRERMRLYTGFDASTGAAVIPFIRSDGMFRHYLMGGLQYSNAVLDASFGYRCVWAPGQGVLEHTFTAGKNFTNASLYIGAAIIRAEEKYRPVFRQTDFSAYAGVTVSL